MSKFFWSSLIRWLLQCVLVVATIVVLQPVCLAENLKPNGSSVSHSTDTVLDDADCSLREESWSDSLQKLWESICTQGPSTARFDESIMDDVPGDFIVTILSKPKYNRHIKATGLTLKNMRVTGQVLIPSGKIPGNLSFSHLKFEGPVTLDKVTVEGSISFTDSSFQNINLGGARIKGFLSLKGSDALQLNGIELKVDRSLLITNQSDTNETGKNQTSQNETDQNKKKENITFKTIWLDDLKTQNLTITNVDADILHASGAKVDGTLELTGSNLNDVVFSESTIDDVLFGRNYIKGSIDLSYAHVNHTLELTETTFHEIFAPGLKVDDSLKFRVSDRQAYMPVEETLSPCPAVEPVNEYLRKMQLWNATTGSKRGPEPEPPVQMDLRDARIHIIETPPYVSMWPPVLYMHGMNFDALRLDYRRTARKGIPDSLDRAWYSCWLQSISAPRFDEQPYKLLTTYLLIRGRLR
ncbi:pentapeptide repeat-containing protein [Caballeronia novacaledonica]|uniref:Uncharacterized protein n=1 Tax=Caballeronia novacaledonica TaxID=1544861 RepID=A0AA37IMZ4_9BURK|nr:pentapeptide repeat-containing protein [Caballeronia novacaledonica]GJH29315.1 hypothetical protein CBA19CS42_32385 [Caballeronia novacaledonica]